MTSYNTMLMAEEVKLLSSFLLSYRRFTRSFERVGAVDVPPLPFSVFLHDAARVRRAKVVGLNYFIN